MNSRSLDPAQRRRLERALRKKLAYLDQLTGRMHQKFFPRDDPLWVAAEAARQAMQRLYDVAQALAEEKPDGSSPHASRHDRPTR